MGSITVARLSIAGGRPALAVVVAALIGACAANAASSSRPTATATATRAGATATAMPVVATVAPPTATPIATTGPASTSDKPSAPLAAPPKPSGVAFKETRKGDNPLTTEITQTVTWVAPRTEDVKIRVYGITACISRPANPAPDTSGPCLVE